MTKPLETQDAMTKGPSNRDINIALTEARKEQEQENST